ncbi:MULTISPECIES: DoxX family protein [unclassified Lysobacter]|uniref:DoxX family protein n=1 Tax=unclassified Lysobacter TaxID=2635362 RepID=UPI000AE2A282|nr:MULTISPECIES: DoxX family protein [unclassified Lysobacter]
MNALRRWLTSRWLRRIALLLICAAYLQGGLTKAWNFAGAIAEMQHFGLQPAAPMAALVIVVELGAALLIISGYRRWLGALVLAAFTVAATFVANRYWAAPAAEQAMLANAFFEHLGLAGAFVLIAWHDLAPHDLASHEPEERR